MSQSAKKLSHHASWDETLAYFRARKAVIFASYTQFWEKHAFVQQSLAKLLTDHGIAVHWYEGDRLRPEKPIVPIRSPLLSVKTNFILPGQRFEVVRQANSLVFATRVKRLVKQYGNPVIWLQGGLREEWARRLPYIDVVSTFDDPFHFCDDSVLKSRAKLFLAQNSFTQAMHPDVKGKSEVLFPPIDMKFSEPKATPLPLPERFPKKIMGYIGSFFSDDYDLELFEYLVRTLPDWGFLLAGRGDEVAHSRVEHLKRYPNFFHVPWVPREQAVGLWKNLSVTLLLHRPRRTQYGAFPTKLLESTYYGVPCVGTVVPKTQDLKGYFPLSSFPSELRRLAVEASYMPKSRVREIFELFSEPTDPKTHLIEVASRLR